MGFSLPWEERRSVRRWPSWCSRAHAPTDSRGRRPRSPRAVSLWLCLHLFGLANLGLGCAVRPSPVAPEPHLPMVAVERPRRPDVAIGLAPFGDLRSELSLDPQRPPLGPAWLGIVREGENSTGAGSFLRDVSSAAREDAARTLRYSQLFREVRLVDSATVPEGLDFVLTGDIEELVGFQFQRTALGLFSVAGYQSRLDPPIGTARVRFRLIGPAGEIWSQRIETRVQTEGISMEQVALDALAATNERLAIALFQMWSESAQEAPRRVPVRVLDACGLGGRRARQLVDDAGEIFTREVRVAFRPSIETWLAPEQGGAGALLDAAEELSPPEGGFILVLAPRDRGPLPPLRRERSGLARQLGRHAVVICSGVEPQIVTVAHEIAHLFGAVHSPDRGSIMHAIAFFEARFFDPANRRILASSRDRPFGEPLPADLVRRLRAAYSEGAAQDEIAPAVLQAALRALP